VKRVRGDAGFRVIVPDLRGFGASDKPGAVDAYRITRSVADVVAILDAASSRRGARSRRW
jgi:pimeloyl-ACP methyl ester carboxylesterase